MHGDVPWVDAKQDPVSSDLMTNWVTMKGLVSEWIKLSSYNGASVVLHERWRQADLSLGLPFVRESDI